MLLKKLSIVNYKNLREVDMALSPKLNCLVGQNGMGKTNLLDAVYYLSFCKSAGSPIDSQNITHEADFFMLQGTYETDPGDEVRIYCGMKRHQKKHFKRDQKEYTRLADHIGYIPLVMVSPADHSLILGGSEERRRFMDTVIAQYDKEYLAALIRYNRALQQRNTLLKKEEPVDDSLFESIDTLMAEDGTLVYERRRDFVRDFIPIFQRFYSRIAQDREQVSLSYASHAERGDLRLILRQSLPKDKVVGFSLHGIHKDELDMKLGDYAMKREGSQGQNKTYLVALKLAQFEFLKQISHKAPILLLDDVFDKLDAQRVEQIVKLVAEDSFGQIFMTDTNREDLDRVLHKVGGDYRLFDVSNGIIRLHQT